MFILQNQDGYFLSKSGEWLDGREPSALFRTTLKDEAVNQLFETNSKDYSLRIAILECEANLKKHPVIATEHLPPPIIDNADLDIHELDLGNIDTENAFLENTANNG